MTTQSTSPRSLTRAALLLGIAASALAFTPIHDAVASSSASRAVPLASMGVMPVVVDGVFYKMQSSWTERCSGSLYIQNLVGSEWPSESNGDYRKILRGVTTYIKPADNGGNDGDFYWRCGNTRERSDAPGNGFSLLRVVHSDSDRKIDMIALDKCGNGTTMAQCF